MTSLSQPGYFSRQIAAARRFYLGREPGADGGLAVVSGGCEHCAPEYEIHRRSLPFRGVEFVASGRGWVRYGQVETEITAGAVFSYGPRTAHDIVTDPADPLVKYFVDFTGSRAAGLLRQRGLVPGGVVQTSAPGEVMGIFDELIRNGQRHSPFSGRITAVVLEHLLLKLAETAIPNGSATTIAFATYRRCRELIERRWQELDSLAAAAAACHVDGAYLCRLFRRFDRESPYQLLLRLKMVRAAELLRGGRTPVAVVAEELRFADPFHFSRVFKQRMGVAPSVFAAAGGG